MSGIVGLVRADGVSVAPSTIVAMRDRLIHRGPDDAGAYVAGPVGLGARRLAIVDLTASGHQPMASEDGQLWIVFNGEIYNHVELTADLRATGHRFLSRSDTEVVLQLYAKYGEECVRRLNGMFAFAVWDASRRTVFAARDRLGLKPFFYHHTGERIVFASEVKALLEAEPGLRRPDREAVADYLFSGAPLGTKTGFAGVRQLEPGHCLTWREGKLEVTRYWDIAYRYEDARRERDLLAEVAWLIEDAVRMQSRGDVAVGSHLSGGLGSSAVAGYAARYVRPLKTFSIRFDGGDYYDESRHARAVAAHIGASHLDDRPQPDGLAGLLPALIYHMEFGLPVWDAFGYFAVSRLARRHVKVSLTGHGSDELFAGYPKHFGTILGSTDMFDIPGPTWREPSVLQRLRTVWRREGVAGVGSRLARRLWTRTATFGDRWVSAHCATEPLRLLHPGFVGALGDYSARESYLRPLDEARTHEALDQALYHDLRVYLPSLLAMEDRISMAVSLESRAPLLDHRLVELLARIPPALKVSGRQPKRLLREAVRPLLPPSVVERRDNRTFPIPVEEWFARDLFGSVCDILKSPQCLDRGVFHADRLRAGPLPPTVAWPLINVELWHRIFVDQDPDWVERATALMRTSAGAQDGRTEARPLF